MAQIFDRSANWLTRASLLLSGLLIVVIALTLNELQRSPWVTRQGQRAAQPVPFSHKHHVQGLGLQCQYCHTSVEKSSYAGIPPTKTCINCHSQIWTNANLLDPVRESWATGESIKWTQSSRSAGLCFLQSLGACEQGTRMFELSRPGGQHADYVCGEHAADGVVFELPSQSGEEFAADQPDLQHGMGRADGGKAGLVRGEDAGRGGAERAAGRLHDQGSGDDTVAAGVAADAGGTGLERNGCGRGDDDAGSELSEVHQPAEHGTFSGRAVPHKDAAGVVELRDVPPVRQRMARSKFKARFAMVRNRMVRNRDERDED